MKFLVFSLTTYCFYWPAFGQWQLQTVATDANFRAVSIAGANIAWVGGTKGTFLRTTDGGKTWLTGNVPDAQNCDFRDVQAIDEQTAYLMSAGPAEQGQARIYKTTNGGQTWALLYETKKKGVFFDGIAFWDKQRGLIFSDPIGGRWFMLTTDDGGQTWQQVPETSLPIMEPNEAAFAASGTSLVVQGKRNAWIASGGGTNARVFRSIDQGRTWGATIAPLPSGEATGLFGMQFFNEKVGMVVGGNYKQEQLPGPNAAITRDGGQTWQRVTPTDPPGLKEAIALLPNDRLLAVGPSGTTLSADQGQTWQRLDNEGFHSVACAKGTCYAVGAKGRVAIQRFK
ncbi:oxidoreductase [Spirosoma sp. BT702]|uniref:Oxidoreductase n=1 Tax=Spirosoma profusum TaxID=2771354 RepID=A0A927AN18_9BACT|nr:YCF48-related protein [Spirosoma profusum]MBD2700934.1 oxidoreductase [Spirosoma profusum]